MCDLAMLPQWWFIPRMPRLHAAVHCESGDVELNNFVMPTIYHRIKVRRKSTNDGREEVEERVETAYVFKEGKGTGEDWWTMFVIVTYLVYVRVKWHDLGIDINLQPSLTKSTEPSLRHGSARRTL
jgi:hypothetical protein